MADYQEFLDGIDRAAYHEGEWQWEEDGYTVTRTYNYRRRAATIRAASWPTRRTTGW